MDTTFQTASMPSSTFFYYNPDPQDTRQSGHFVPQHYQYQHQQHLQHQLPVHMGLVKQQLPPQYIFCPPHNQAMASTMYTPRLLTPVASPYGIQGRQSYFVEQHSSPAMFAMDPELGPSTPPLSASGSSTSSPPANFSMLPTPVNNQYIEALDVKYAMYPDMHTGRDWDVQSPPMSPGKLPTCSTSIAC